jgi:hypothetical protein
MPLPFAWHHSDLLALVAEQAENKEKQQKQSEMVKASANDIMNTIDYLLEDGSINQFGLTGPVWAVPGSEKRTWLANLNYLKGKQVLDLMSQLKQASRTGATGFGQLSEKELKLLENSANKLERGLPKDAAKEELLRLKNTVNKVLGDGGQGGPSKEEAIAELKRRGMLK